MRKWNIPIPKGMLRPHAHHIVFQERFWHLPEMRRALVESRAILRKYGINPYRGKENLVWAPNVKGMHTTENAKKVRDLLKKADAKGGEEDVLEALEKAGEWFAGGAKGSL